jgi:hypothetical protein
MRRNTSTTGLAIVWGLPLLLGCSSGATNDVDYLPGRSRSACADVRRRISLPDGQPIPKGVTPPRIRFLERPAASQKTTGSVACAEATVGVDGLLHDVEIIKVVGSVQWARSVQEALNAARFEPAMKDGEPLPVRMSIGFGFESR